MAIDPAIVEALELTLDEAIDQSDDFKKRFRHLIKLVIGGNYEDQDVRNVMDSIHVIVQQED
jgi:hypothetical protein